MNDNKTMLIVSEPELLGGGGGGDPTSVDELSKISKFVDELFCQK